ncbi:MAG: ATP-binding protein [Solobacterium sp.]|jgi:predicted AAA+ superfamily ATPase|nr:ATP-binding protein [Solobacterium sp.]MCH4205711.1 ATP-binding protein [Solobacterium sp.]MCH4227235.1 ATP-binding protein [Solobacterium sp.]MCH4282541.1 ATP-binding protein [Solobacterium sp.]
MYRTAIEKLYEWKNSIVRKPLIIEGARQVGKTWLMKEFGSKAYKNTVYINFDANEKMAELFSTNLNTDRIILGLELYSGQKIEADNTLIIFDEIQEVPKALSSLKYFYENAPQYHIICAGSLLGIALHEGTSFPVGKVNFLKLYPLSFHEFLIATANERFSDLLNAQEYDLISSFKQTYIDELKHYYFVGGMPEAVVSFAENHDFNKVRDIQNNILAAYEQDFSKHAPYSIVPKIRMIWNSIPSQLAKENKKFIYGLVREGARAKDYEAAIMWLTDCGLIYKINRVSTANLPLKAYEDPRAFKLYVMDVGLLSCMAGLQQRTLLDGNNMFTEFKGALTEQYVCQQLKTIDNLSIYYFTNDRGSCEVDFIISNGEKIIPVEVKAEVNLKAKSLQVFKEKYKPEISVRTSMTNYKKEGWLLNLPLYAVSQITKECIAK